MHLMDPLYSYYRSIISSLNATNTYETNAELLREINDVNPEVVRGAYGLINDCKIVRFVYSPDDETELQAFYALDGNEKECLFMSGFCTCKFCMM
ncbi:conserved hypothetical protein [Theileria equi strain WA]|uniref:Uncharacterized protein n=1 Tax=Theileria equi strain WA TaxID=1537102 RepID=L1LAI6_THEEQ|nr:conserved hypothetical protein [Theileria equi strain WA]EKX72326.1 conserved hypothetical protein [Theileria equi strain WA]|eukprot:XP_004831778.1 conserved hypothetical protein [Theileria equi strain WA]